MAKIISYCPRCKAKNEVISSPYMRLDKGTGVTCVNCSLRFCATLRDEDVNALFEEGSTSPVVKGDENYILESMYYPSP